MTSVPQQPAKIKPNGIGLGVDAVLGILLAVICYLVYPSWLLVVIVVVQYLVLAFFTHRIAGKTPGEYMVSLFTKNTQVSQQPDNEYDLRFEPAVSPEPPEFSERLPASPSANAPPQPVFNPDPAQPAATAATPPEPNPKLPGSFAEPTSTPLSERTAPTAPALAGPITTAPESVTPDSNSVEPAPAKEEELDGVMEPIESTDGLIIPPEPAAPPKLGQQTLSSNPEDFQPPAPATTAPNLAAAPAYYLETTEGSRIEIPEEGLVLGRRPQYISDMTQGRLTTLDDGTRKVSRTHCYIAHTTDGLVIHDLGSANGTSIHRYGSHQQVTPYEPTPLKHGDAVSLGGLMVTVGQTIPE